VAALARHRRVQSDQRKFCEAVIERNFFRPAGFVVAALAFITLLAFVNIIIAVTGNAGHRQFLGFNISPMAAFTRQVFVFPFQRKFGVFGMIKFGIFPFLFVVTLLTLITVFAFVNIVSAMAIDAGGAELGFKFALFMAAVAIGGGVAAPQRKMRIAVVIETHRLPAFFAVTFFAISTVLTAMNIVNGVTANASLRCIFKSLRGVTGGAIHLLMCTF